MQVLSGFVERADISELLNRLKICDEYDKLEFEKMFELASEIARPKAIYLEGYIEDRGEDFVVINGVKFTSRILKKNLEKADRIFPYIATCGTELDSIKFSDDFIKQYWWDSIKTCYLNIARENLMEYIKKRFMLKKTSTMVPGGSEPGLWPIEQQKELFSLFGDVERLIGVKLTESCLMIPNKSVSGILFPVEKDFNGCKVCRRKNCSGRSAEFDEVLWRSLEIEASLRIKK
ncbi:MAG: vitamin B12 dependent methionine synthase [Candidatus Omnitrophica bacterium]|nr:vitamin B12 dependent methionine synthase [Candidatus Omnitrophota bacterium]